MSLSFFVNNFHFAFELVGAVALLMAAWLTFDTYAVRKETVTLIRAIGFTLFAVWQVIYAINIGGDVLSYVGFSIFLIGLICIAGSFLTVEKLQVQAVLIVPAFSLWSGPLHAVAAALLLLIAVLSFRQSWREHNPSWRPFTYGFGVLALGSLIGIVDHGSGSLMVRIAQSVCEVTGFILIARWVWQFLALRVRESLVLILISAALFLATLVTLAFSTILITQVARETEASLITDTKVLNLAIDGLSRESGAKTAFIALDPALAEAVLKNDFDAMSSIAEAAMEEQHLGFITIADTTGGVLVRAHALSRRGDTLLGERALEEALRGISFTTIESSPIEKLSIRSGAPIVSGGEVIGAVIAGFPLDNAFVDNLKRVAGLDMFVYEGDSSVAATAFATDGRTRLTGVRVTSTEVLEGVLEDGMLVTAAVDLRGQPFRASYLPLINGDDKTIGMIAAAKPEQEILDIVNATNRLTLITIICVMLILAFPIYFFTRRLTEA